MQQNILALFFLIILQILRNVKTYSTNYTLREENIISYAKSHYTFLKTKGEPHPFFFLVFPYARHLPRALQAFSYLIMRIILGGDYYYYYHPPFIDKETEAFVSLLFFLL